MKEIDHLLRLFEIRKPVKFKHAEQGEEVIATSQETIIKADDEAIKHDLPDLVALAKLAETNPLLATFFFQTEYTQTEAGYMTMFHSLCQPLQDAWVWKLKRRYDDASYDEDIGVMTEMLQHISQANPVIDKDLETRRLLLGQFLILHEGGRHSIDIKFTHNNEHAPLWDAYLAALKKFSRQEPDIKCYLRLPELSGAPYTVDIVSDRGEKVFLVKEKTLM